MVRCSRIVGTGSYLPPFEVNNEELARIVGKKTGEWIERRLGIKQRRFFSPIDRATGRAKEKVDEIWMAEIAARRALQSAKLEPEQISGLWYVTCTQEPDEYLHFSRGAIELHHQLGLSEDAFALEIDSGCGGVMQAVGVTNDMMKGDDKPNVLVVASNAPSLFVDRDIYTTAGACWVFTSLATEQGQCFFKKPTSGGMPGY